MSRLTKKQKRTMRQQGIIDQEGKLRERVFKVNPEIAALTAGQSAAWEAWQEEYNLILHGSAGTGKSFLGMYFAFYDLLDKSSPRKKVYVIRSTVSTRDQGFQPGNKNEKEAVYETPYPSICNQIFGRGDAYTILKQKNMVEFTSTSFLRSVTLDDAYIVVDEAQNMNYGELSTVITRAGENTKFVFCGDTHQNDLTHKKSDQSGLIPFMKIVENMNSFDIIEFNEDDIVRSGLVKEFIVTENKLKKLGVI